MATLYELTEQLQAIYNMDIDETTKEDTIESASLLDDLEEKAEGYAKVIRTLEADAVAYAEEEKRFKEKKERAKAKASYLKETLQQAMALTGRTKIDGKLFKLAIQKTKASVIVDEAELPSKYLIAKTTTVPDKKTLYDLLKSGQEIKGASLKENQTLRIK